MHTHETNLTFAAPMATVLPLNAYASSGPGH